MLKLCAGSELLKTASTKRGTNWSCWDRWTLGSRQFENWTKAANICEGNIANRKRERHHLAGLADLEGEGKVRDVQGKVPAAAADRLVMMNCTGGAEMRESSFLL